MSHDQHSGSDDQIRQKAYYLWVQAGMPEDRDQEFWFAAVDQSTDRDSENLLEDAEQADDNIDEFGRSINGGDTLDQPAR